MWKHSINRPIVIDNRISLITAVFSDRRVAQAVRCLSRDDAQAFVDVVDEVLLRSSARGKWLTGLNSQFPFTSSRHWITWGQGSRGSV